MDSKYVIKNYWKFILIFIVAMAIVSLYKIDILARVIADKDIYSFIEITSIVLITSALLYVLMVLINMFKQE